MKLHPHIISKIKSCIEKYAPEAETILYGSQARGDAREDSDVDILILLPDYYDGKEFVEKKLELSGHLYDLSLSLGIDISSLILISKVFYSLKTPFTVNVTREGVVL